MGRPLITYYTADFETRASNEAKTEEITWVWGWSLTNIKTLETETGNTINTFIDRIKKTVNRTNIFFHNLKFDGKFLLDYLLKNGYEHTTSYTNFKENKSLITTLIDETGNFYSISMKSNNSKKITFIDSLKKIPFSVEKIANDFKLDIKKGSIDYTKERSEGHIMTEEEREYIINDTLIMSKALSKTLEKGFTKITLASDALTFYKDLITLPKFNTLFPEIDTNQDAFIRKCYRGGWCYKVDWAEGLIRGKGETYDVNSLYPSMMHSNTYVINGKHFTNDYPIYNGTYFTGPYIFDSKQPIYFVRIKTSFTVKDNYLPTIQLKSNFRFRENEYIKDSEGVVELYLSNVDLNLLKEHYDIHYIEYIEGYKYCSAVGLFDKYINHFLKIKDNCEGAEKAIGKLFLNSLYGKFAEKIEIQSKIPFLDGDIVRYKLSDIEQKKGTYTPVAAMVTAYARRFTISTAQQHYDPANKKGFIYADTDSIHVVDTDVNIPIDEKKLGCWKLENSWNEAVFVRQKTYLEKNEDNTTIKCAGMPQTVKDMFIEDVKNGNKTLNDFKLGLTYPRGKLRAKTVNGGVILVDTSFSLN